MLQAIGPVWEQQAEAQWLLTSIPLSKEFLGWSRRYPLISMTLDQGWEVAVDRALVLSWPLSIDLPYLWSYSHSLSASGLVLQHDPGVQGQCLTCLVWHWLPAQKHSLNKAWGWQRSFISWNSAWWFQFHIPTASCTGPALPQNWGPMHKYLPHRKLHNQEASKLSQWQTNLFSLLCLLPQFTSSGSCCANK